jgi:hypothetical protein
VINTGDHPGSCVECGGDAPEGVPICGACGEHELLMAVEEELDALKAAARRVFDLFGHGVYRADHTKALRELERLSR